MWKKIFFPFLGRFTEQEEVEYRFRGILSNDVIQFNIQHVDERKKLSHFIIRTFLSVAHTAHYKNW